MRDMMLNLEKAIVSEVLFQLCIRMLDASHVLLVVNSGLTDWVIWQSSYLIWFLQEFRETTADLVSQ